jgi:hypothetical protein
MKHINHHSKKQKKGIGIFKWLYPILFIPCNFLGAHAQPLVTTASSADYFFTSGPRDGNINSFYYYIDPPVANSNCRFFDRTTAINPDTKSVIGFIELADGCFSFGDAPYIVNGHSGYSLFCLKHDFTGRARSLSNLNGNDAVAKLTGIYGTPPRPGQTAHGMRSAPGQNRTYDILDNLEAPGGGSVNAETLPHNEVLRAGEKLKITSNVWNIAPNDIMTFVVTYKLNVSDPTSSIIFTYNMLQDRNRNISSKGIFNQAISGATVNVDYLDADQTGDITGMAIPNYRSYAGEICTPNRNFPTITITNLQKDGEEHNVFINLFPKYSDEVVKNFVDNGGEAIVQAKMLTPEGANNFKSKLASSGLPILINMIKESKFGPGLDETFNLNLPVASVHDPNHISIRPTCIAPNNKPVMLDYSVTFQNIGRMVVTDTIKIDVFIGDNIDMGSFQPATVIGFCGTNGNSRRQLPNAESQGSPIIAGQQNLQYSINPGRKTVTFFIINNSGSLLDGALSIYDLSNDKTKGEIRFQIKSNANIPNPGGIQSYASITFAGTGAMDTDRISVGQCKRKWLRCSE